MTKASLRKELLAKRQQFSPDDAERGNDLITSQLLPLLNTKNFSILHIFLPQYKKQEVDTWRIIKKLQTSFTIDIAVPRIIPGTRLMQHFLLTPTTTLTENQWGIPEPHPLISTEIFPQNIDIVLIPLLAFDKNGFRVGYGGGFYDRFLAECRVETLKIGLSFFEPVESIEDINEFDIRMDYCVTPNDVWKW